jgi:hypothetical protein
MGWSGRSRPLRVPLLADGTLGIVALCQSHVLEALTFAGTLTLTAVGGGLAVVLAFAAIHAVAMHLCFFGHDNSGHAGEQRSRGESDGSTSSGSSDRHAVILEWFRLPIEQGLFDAGIPLESGHSQALQAPIKMFNTLDGSITAGQRCR